MGLGDGRRKSRTGEDCDMRDRWVRERSTKDVDAR